MTNNEIKEEKDLYKLYDYVIENNIIDIETLKRFAKKNKLYYILKNKVYYLSFKKIIKYKKEELFNKMEKEEDEIHKWYEETHKN